MCCNFLIRGDLLSPPFENRRFIVGALIGAGASILGAKLNADAVAKNNQRQEQLIQVQNAYNAPEQQVARMRQAGLNPYMMLGQVNPGNQSSIASTSSPDLNSSVSNVNTAAQMVQQSSLVAAQVRDMNAEAAGKEIDNQTKQDFNLQQLELLRSQVNGQSIVNNAAQYDLDYMKPAQLQELQGNIDKIAHETALTMQKVGTESLNQDQLIKQIEQLGLDNKRARAVLPFVIRSAELENKEQAMRVSTGYQNAFTNRLSAYAAQTSAGAALMNAQSNSKLLGHQVGLIDAQANGQRWSNRLASKSYYWQPRLWSAQEDAIYNNINLGVANATNGFLNTVLNGVQAVGQYNNFGSLETVHTTNYDSRGNVKSSSKTMRGRRR